MIRFLQFGFFFPALLLSYSVLTADSTTIERPDSSEINPQAVFNRGNFLFEQQQYPEALDIYHSIHQSGFESGPLYLNMGMSYAYMDSLGLSLFYFKKAEQFRQTESQASAGVEFVTNRLAQRQTIIPELATFRLATYLFTDLGYITPFIWALILLNLFVICWVISWFIERGKRIVKILSITFMLFGAISAGLSVYIFSFDGQYEYGIYYENGHSVYETPDLDSEPVFLIFEGYTFLKYTTESPEGSGWSYIQMSNGIEGWVKNRGFKLH